MTPALALERGFPTRGSAEFIACVEYEMNYKPLVKMLEPKIESNSQEEWGASTFLSIQVKVDCGRTVKWWE